MQDLLNYLMSLREKHLDSVCFTKIKARRQQIPKPKSHTHILLSQQLRPCTDEISHPRGVKPGALGKQQELCNDNYVSPEHSQHGA